MRAVGLVVIAASVGCGFHVGGGNAIGKDADGDGASDGASDGAIDGPIDGGLDAAIDAPGDAAAAFCVPSAALRACYTFEGNATDGSGNGNTATTSGVTYGAGVAGQAVQISSGDTLLVAASASLNVTMLTIDMWVRPTTLPGAGLRMGLLDSGGRYRMFLQPGGAVRCGITGGADLISPTGDVAANTWTRVTCTYNGTTIRIYINGAERTSSNQISTIPTLTGGMVIGHNNPTGENLDGAIDNLRIWGAIVPPI